MNAHRANLINSVILMAASVWLYVSHDKFRVAVIVFMVLGVALLSLNNGVKYGLPSQIRAAVFFSAVAFLYCLYLVLPLFAGDADSTHPALLLPAVSSMAALTWLAIGRKAHKPSSKND